MKARCLLFYLPNAQKTKTSILQMTWGVCVSVFCVTAFGATNAKAQSTGAPLTITNESAPPVYDTRSIQNRQQARSRAQNWPERRSSSYEPYPGNSRNNRQFSPPEKTHVTKKVSGLRKEYRNIANTVKKLRGQLADLQQETLSLSNTYFADIAAINTKLQTGTTPGNPRLKRRLSAARANLDSLSQVMADLNALSSDVGDASSRASTLMENIRSAYNISGAVEADHEALTRLEDDLQDLLITLDRTQKKVSDSTTRTRSYLGSESENLRTLSLAVANGNYYGRSLSYRPFSNVPQTSSASMFESQAQGRGAQRLNQRNAAFGIARGPQNQESRTASRNSQSGAFYGKRPVMKIRFTKPNVEYEQALYNAISDAQEKYPDARFELVAVYPENGNAARSAIESTRARRNAEKVLGTMREMGLPARNVQLSRQTSKSASTNEVHIYLRSS